MDKYGSRFCPHKKSRKYPASERHKRLLIQRTCVRLIRSLFLTPRSSLLISPNTWLIAHEANPGALLFHDFAYIIGKLQRVLNRQTFDQQGLIVQQIGVEI